MIPARGISERMGKYRGAVRATLYGASPGRRPALSVRFQPAHGWPFRCTLKCAPRHAPESVRHECGYGLQRCIGGAQASRLGANDNLAARLREGAIRRRISSPGKGASVAGQGVNTSLRTRGVGIVARAVLVLAASGKSVGANRRAESAGWWRREGGIAIGTSLVGGGG